MFVYSQQFLTKWATKEQFCQWNMQTNSILSAYWSLDRVSHKVITSLQIKSADFKAIFSLLLLLLWVFVCTLDSSCYLQHNWDYTKQYWRLLSCQSWHCMLRKNVLSLQMKLLPPSGQMMETAGSSEMSLHSYQITWYHKLDDSNPQGLPWPPYISANW